MWAIFSIVLGTILAVTSGGLIAAEKLLAARYSASVHQEHLIAPGARSGETSLAGPLNFLLIGSDQRVKNPTMGARSDTIIIVHVPVSLDRAYLISIPRDLRVTIPPDPSAGYHGGTGKINAAFQFGGRGNGGVQLLSETLTKLVGIHFDGAAVVNFGGFDKVVKALGGVRLCVDDGPVKSIHTGFVFHSGCRDYTATQVLDYLRQRETLPGGDFDRQRHQQQFLKAIFAKTFANGLAQNPLRIDEVIRDVGQSLTVDTNGVPIDQLVYTFRKIRPDALVGIRLPATTDTIGGVSYVLATDVASSLYSAIYSDTLDEWIATHRSWVNTL